MVQTEQRSPTGQASSASCISRRANATKIAFASFVFIRTRVTEFHRLHNWISDNVVLVTTFVVAVAQTKQRSETSALRVVSTTRHGPYITEMTGILLDLDGGRRRRGGGVG